MCYYYIYIFCFQNILSLFCSCLIITCLGLIFSEFILFGVHRATWTCKFMSFKFQKISAISSLHIFSCINLSFLIFWNSNDTNFREFDIVQQIAKDLFIFSQSFFLFFRLNNFYWSTSSLTFFSVISVLHLSPSNIFLNFKYCIFHF